MPVSNHLVGAFDGQGSFFFFKFKETDSIYTYSGCIYIENLVYFKKCLYVYCMIFMQEVFYPVLIYVDAVN